ncbi:MAG: 50S ribosomal protein L4 [candidate division Zixibacteria bacterium]|nr:50S ribosomal protein L4 [candidate division Zixibacteria bacterium]
MAEAKVFDVKGNSKESRPLDGPLFNSDVKEHLLHEYVVGYRRNLRQGTASTKTRAMVRGGGKRPWRQKGTGRARAGTNTSPIWEGGGVAFGPHPREYYRPVPKKFKKVAIRSAFSNAANQGNIRVVDLPELTEIKTKPMADFMKSHDVYQKRVLLLFEGKTEHLARSCRNIKGLAVKRSVLVNPFDLIWAEHVLITPDALQKIEEVFGQ